MFVDVHMANMDSIFFRGSLLYLCFLYLFVVGCLGHDFLDGLRPPCILGAFFRRAISVVQGGPPFFYLKNAGVHVSRKIPRRIHFSIAPSIAPSFLSSFTFSFVLSFFSDPFLDTSIPCIHCLNGPSQDGKNGPNLSLMPLVELGFCQMYLNVA